MVVYDYVTWYVQYHLISENANINPNLCAQIHLNDICEKAITQLFQ